MSGKLYDVSMAIHPGMLTYPGDPPMELIRSKSLSQGATSNVSLIRMGTHTGTHVDAPAHFIPGANGVDRIPGEYLIGPARVLQFPKAHHINRQALEGVELRGVTRLLLGTRNSRLIGKADFDRDFAFLTEDAARYVLELGVKVVGIDYLSIEEYHKEGHPVHQVLLRAGVVIIEGLDLQDVPPGDYELYCLPLRISDADGAPARAFLRDMT